MKKSDFKQLLETVDRLPTGQFRELNEHINQFIDINFVSVDLETNFNEIKCPHCKKSNIKRWGKRSDLQRYKCKECGKTFNSLTGTPLANLRKKGKWLDFSKCLIDGISVRKAAELCKVHKNTSFRWRHRFLTNLNSIKSNCLNGIVEADDIYFMESEKGNKQLSRKPRKRGIKDKKDNEEVCVVICRDRNKNTHDKLFKRLNYLDLSIEFDKIISKDSLLCSTNKSAYRNYTQQNSIRHASLDELKAEETEKDIVHLKNVHTYESNLHSWMYRFHGVATKYLNNYLSWFRGLDEFGNTITPSNILIRAKCGGVYKRLPITQT